MEVVIFSKMGGVVTTVKPLESSELVQSIHGDDYVRLNFVLTAALHIPIGCFIILGKTAARYTILDTYRRETSPNNYVYECIFKGIVHEFVNARCLLKTAKPTGGRYTDYQFSLTGDATTFLQFIVNNLQATGIAITVGTAKATATRTIAFNSWDCLQACQAIAEELDFGFYVEAGVLHFNSREVNTYRTLMVGELAGIELLTRFRADTTVLSTCVYGYGSTKNLPARTGAGVTYDGALLTENRLSFVGVDGESKLCKNTALYGIRQEIQEFEEIYPTHTGTVTAIGSSVYGFTDNTFPFDVNDYLLAGIPPKITFLSGLLVGRTFNISQANGIDFLLDAVSDETGGYPNTSFFPQVGDTYTIFDIYFPTVYLTEAQERLKQATQAHLDKVSVPQCAYEAKLDPQYMRLAGVNLLIGDVVRIVSAEDGLDDLYDIKELVTPCFTSPYNYTIKFGAYLPKTLLTRLRDTAFITRNTVDTIQGNTVTNNSVTNIIGDSFTWKQF